MAASLARGWRSGAPQHLLDHLLRSCSSVHELSCPETQAIAASPHFVPMGAAISPRAVALLGAVTDHVQPSLQAALATAQNDDEPWSCPACIAEAASLS
jgi:hypothetical protein